MIYTANDLSAVSADYICVTDPPTDASEFNKFLSAIL